MCQVRLIPVPGHTYPFQHVYRLGITKYLDVPGTINKRSLSQIPTQHIQENKLLRCVILRSTPDHTYLFQYVYTLGIRKY